MLGKIFSREWILTTVIVILGSALCVRLGIWQLDRLAQRRSFNSHVEAMWAADPLSLPADRDLDLIEMEYRAICVSGEYDFENQVVIRNQYWEDQYGYHLLTPMLISDRLAIMVDRGWIPAQGNEQQEDWRQYDTVESGEICGIIRPGREKPDVGGRPDPTLEPDQGKLDIWNNVNLARISDQLPYELLPIYIQLDEISGDRLPPIPFQPEIEISEGPHLGYAGQWFMFATILFFGYPFFIKWRERNG
jgi:surfeit locus 1 family protein